MKKLKLLIHPFEVCSEKRLIRLGALFSIIGALLAYAFNGRFDNFLHFSPIEQVAIWQPFIDILIILSCLFVFLFLAGWSVNRKTRPADMLAVVLVGNAPFYIMAFSNINNYAFDATKTLMPLLSHPDHPIPINSIIFLTCIGLIGLLVSIWVIALLYNGFRTAANAKGTKAVLLFVAALLISLLITLIIPSF